ncbi:MAG TPA: hypothetical protein VG710_01615 [Opitutus sp.]|nr:hypothetical protein [Opitutus sp.]
MTPLLRLRVLLFCLATSTAFAGAGSLFPLWQPPGTAGLLPYGAGVTWTQQKQAYTLDDLTFAVPGGFPAVGQLRPENRSRAITVRPNLWLLPFLQLYGVAGHVVSDTTVSNIPLVGEVVSRNTGTYYGGGAVLAYGRHDWFASVDVNYTYADMSGVDDSQRTLTLQPQIGRNFGRLSTWLGAMYEDTAETTSGVFPLTGFGDVPYRVKLKTASPWNGRVGAQWNFNPHVGLAAELGFGARTGVLTSLEFAW